MRLQTVKKGDLDFVLIHYLTDRELSKSSPCISMTTRTIVCAERVFLKLVTFTCLLSTIQSMLAHQRPARVVDPLPCSFTCSGYMKGLTVQLKC